jgi:hypothetical protein
MNGPINPEVSSSAAFERADVRLPSDNALLIFAEGYVTDLLFPKSVAYHEAGHVVVAAVLGLRLHARGSIRTDRQGKGEAHYDRRKPGTKSGFDLQGKHTVVANYAGLIAQQKFHPSCSTLCANDDEEKSRHLLIEMYERGQKGPKADFIAAVAAVAATEHQYRNEARMLVEHYWCAITALAEALWQVPADKFDDDAEAGCDWIIDPRNKQSRLDAAEVAHILKPHGVDAFIAEG